MHKPDELNASSAAIDQTEEEAAYHAFLLDEGLEFLKAYRSVEDPHLRRAMLLIVQALGNQLPGDKLMTVNDGAP